MAAKLKAQPFYETALGFSFEKVCMYARTLGIGSVIMVSTLSRRTFEQAMDLQPGEVMPVVTPLGYPSEARMEWEKRMRQALHFEWKRAFEENFRKEDFSHPLTKGDAGVFADALEGFGLAPSGTNQQPWMAVKSGNTIHFYEAQTHPANPSLDIQLIDVGCGLAHFDLIMNENGYTGEYFRADPGLLHPDNCHYVISYRLG